MKILIVEDEPFAADDLHGKLEQLQHHVIAIAEDYNSAVKAIESEIPDLVIIDIGLKGERSGIDLGGKLAAMHIPHMYLSGIQDMNTYIQAKNTTPLRNLAKPIDLINLRNALDVDLPAQKLSRTIYLITDGNKGKQRINPDTICYIEADGSYCGVYLEDKMYKLTINLKAVLQKLDWPGIVRVSKSHAINLQYVKSKLGNRLELTNGVKIDIEPKYKEQVSLYLKSI
ncbi:response regulator transcription factor [Fluviicola sp.]|uniref:LytR/AlgR family response regulator transcription factor n=1 Tax=Fluviicola sp. TaxID=1917219 RepID=UPI0031D80DCD